MEWMLFFFASVIYRHSRRDQGLIYGLFWCGDIYRMTISLSFPNARKVIINGYMLVVLVIVIMLIYYSQSEDQTMESKKELSSNKTEMKRNETSKFTATEFSTTETHKDDIDERKGNEETDKWNKINEGYRYGKSTKSSERLRELKYPGITGVNRMGDKGKDAKHKNKKDRKTKAKGRLKGDMKEMRMKQTSVKEIEHAKNFTKFNHSGTNIEEVTFKNKKNAKEQRLKDSLTKKNLRSIGHNWKT